MAERTAPRPIAPCPPPTVRRVERAMVGTRRKSAALPTLHVIQSASRRSEARSALPLSVAVQPSSWALPIRRSRCQTARAANDATHDALSRSRGASRPGFANFPPREGWAERRQAPGACEAPVPANNARGRGACEARPGVPCDRDAAPLGAPSLAIFGLGSAFPAPPFPAEHVQPAPGSTGRSARRAVSEPSGATVTSRGRRTPRPAPPSGSSLEDAPQ
jgi:hypothetical protein